MRELREDGGNEMSVTLELRCRKHRSYKGHRLPKYCAACMFIYDLRPLGEGVHEHRCGAEVVLAKFVSESRTPLAQPKEK